MKNKKGLVEMKLASNFSQTFFVFKVRHELCAVLFAGLTPMVAHNAVATQTHLKSLNPFSQDIFKGRKVLIFFKDSKFTIGTV